MYALHRRCFLYVNIVFSQHTVFNYLLLYNKYNNLIDSIDNDTHSSQHKICFAEINPFWYLYKDAKLLSKIFSHLPIGKVHLQPIFHILSSMSITL